MLRKLLGSSVVLAVLLIPGMAARADVVSSATIYWDELDLQLIDLSNGANAVQFSWSSEYGQTLAQAETAYPPAYVDQFDDADDFATSLLSSALTANAQANAWRNSSLLQATAESQMGTSPNAPDENWAFALSSNMGTFEVSGQGIVLLTVPWTVSVDGIAGDWEDFATATINIVGTYSDGLFSSGTATSGASLDSSSVGSNTVSGVFSMAITSLPDTLTTGSFTANADAYAQSVNVPEPSSLALMGLGCGLFGWITYRRRRK